VDQKETREIKRELLELIVMATKAFVLLVAKMIGGQYMVQEQLIMSEEYISP
jgi:hypothetical protein|tara:strand:+ start:731 stop:886 length:156 start_codon:yes stop_codon:yes gene_type:complete